MPRPLLCLLLTCCLSPIAWPICAAADERLDFFEKRIRPVLVRHCYQCHSAAADKVKGGLRLDSRDAWKKGGDNGPAIVPGKADESLLVEALRHESLEMPPDKKLPDAVIRDFTHWINDGALDPRDAPPSAEQIAALSWRHTLAERRDWWSLRPVVRPDVPPPSSWSEQPIDRFIEARLGQQRLAPAAAAEPAPLLRRLRLLLTGLPPTPNEVEQFNRENSRDPETAWRRLVDRLLASPEFGERWARHWLDIVRFAETHGYEWNHEIRDVWRYRDYLIRALNDDVPYDQLVREHIAGDLLERPRINFERQLNESLIGTAFWRFGELGHDDCVRFPEIRFDALDNQIDTLGKAFQASTISCARCHDHKLDPISTRDYYALAGILESSRQVVRTIDTPERIAEPARAMRELKAAIRRELGLRWLESADACGKQIAVAIEQQRLGVKPKGGLAKGGLAALLGKDKHELQDPTFLLRQLAAGKDKPVAEVWRKLEEQLRGEHAKRMKFNEQFTTWADFRPGRESGWRTDGLGLLERPSRPGEFTVAASGDRAVDSILPGGIYTHRLSSRMNGTLQSPWLPTDRKFASIEFAGGDLSMIRAVIDSCALNEFVGGGLKYLDGGAWQWMTFPTSAAPTHRTFLELTTKSDNPRWPDRPDRAGTKDPAKLNSPHSWFGVSRVVLHDVAGHPQVELDHLLPLFANGEAPAPQDIAQVAARFQQACRSAVAAWIDHRASEGDVRWLKWMLSAGLLDNETNDDGQLAERVAEYRRLEATLPQPRVVAGMADHGPGFDSPVMLRGNPATPGPLEPRRYLEVLSTSSEAARAHAGSGRRELARAICDPANPLTARVFVNRVWHHLFGAGLVRSTDDFGRLGDRPSHPELLDYLAAEFVEDGWSSKSLIRRIVLSETFRQSAATTDAARKVDPANRLLHHFPVRRLDAEAIRDSLLAVSGRLNRELFGPSVHPHRSEPKEHRKLYAGPLDGDGRRSVYLKVTRMEGPRFLELFDLPDQNATRGRRDRTSVPAQALAMLNDPFLIDQAAHWGGAVVADDTQTRESRIDAMFLRALGRPPNSRERERLSALVVRLAALHKVPANDVLGSAAVWTDVAHALFNMKELIYLR